MKKTIITHSGVFHADDVFAVAVLLSLPDIERLGENQVEIIRTRDPHHIQKGDMVVDVGAVYDPEKNRFDHHQEAGAGARENGIPYASFGLVWKHYGAIRTGSQKVAQELDRELIQPIDALDNGVSIFESMNEDLYPYLIQDIMYILRPTWEEAKSDEDYDRAFMKALELAKLVLDREILHTNASHKAEQYVIEAYERTPDKRIIILEKNFPWERVLSSKLEPLYVIQPDLGKTGYWKIAAVRTEPRSFDHRHPFPVTWAGKRDAELADISGVSDAVFCHNKRFRAAARSREGAILLAQKALALNHH